jgi:ATP-dependent DNA ligase
MIKTYTTPLVCKIDSTGKRRYWIGYVTSDKTSGGVCHYHIQQEYWGIKANGEESKHQVTVPVLVSSKNLGKSNETTPYEQAVSEITSLLNKKLDEQYKEGAEEAEFLPMLAQKFSKKAKFPAFGSPKLDGVRCYVKPDGTFWSRKGKQILPEVVAHIKMKLDGLAILDGELMLPVGEYTFQETISAVKKVSENSPKLIFNIFDCYLPAQPEATFEDRWNRYCKHLQVGSWESCQLVDTRLVDLEAFKLLSANFISQGYEGSIYRCPNGLYRPNVRSSDLLKFKEFVDDEFEVVNVLCGVGREQDCAIFVCKTAEGKEFNVRPQGTLESRKELYANKDKCVGQLLTVVYQELTDDGIPRFPSGKTLRNYE